MGWIGQDKLDRIRWIFHFVPFVSTCTSCLGLVLRHRRPPLRAVGLQLFGHRLLGCGQHVPGQRSHVHLVFGLELTHVFCEHVHILDIGARVERRAEVPAIAERRLGSEADHVALVRACENGER